MTTGNVRSVEGARGGARPVLIATAAALVVVALTFVVVPLGHAFLLISFLEHDARGMPVEPRWTAWLATYGGAALVSLAVGYVLGRAASFRFTHGLATGIAAGLGLVVFWYTKESLRGYEPGALTILTGALTAPLGTAPFMALGAGVGFRSRE